MSTANQVHHSPYEQHRGPNPGALAIVYTTLFIASLIIFGVLSHGAAFPRPNGSLTDAQQVFLRFPDAIKFNALFQFGAAIPLGLFTATVTSRLSFLGVNASGVSIAMFGGITASVFITISSLCGWIMAQPGIADEVHILHAVQLLSFASGGIAHIVALGLLMAGISVPCLLGRYTPKWVAWSGLVLAGIAELSTLSLVIPAAGYLLPLARFGSYIWLISTGFTLTKHRQLHTAL
ncbi:hypothetical protein [Chitinophaga sp. RAB17]|uniref:hypothetical protein n=1 Tax=Chitinophaga sp. RAB17 TaxID=3233049 RepID=UPI003F906C9C